MAKAVKVLIADDHELIRQGLRKVLDSQTDFQVTEAGNGEEAMASIKDFEPDVAILDVEMPKMSGFEVAKQIHHEGISINVIFLTMFKDESMFNKAMDIGVKGYVLKENTVTEIVTGVKSVLAGKHYISPAISDLLIKRNNKLASPASDKDGIDQLTPSELNIMKLLADMKTNQEMAEELGISIKTVQNHRNNICNKLDISGTHALLKFAVENAERI